MKACQLAPRLVDAPFEVANEMRRLNRSIRRELEREIHRSMSGGSRQGQNGERYRKGQYGNEWNRIAYIPDSTITIRSSVFRTGHRVCEVMPADTQVLVLPQRLKRVKSGD